MSRSPGDLILKDPASTEPQGFNWTAYLAELGAGVTISVSTYAVTPASLTLSGAAIGPGGLTTTVNLSSGTLGLKYTVTNHITTTSGVIDERSFDVLVENL